MIFFFANYVYVPIYIYISLNVSWTEIIIF